MYTSGFFFFFDCSRGLLRPELPLVMVHGLGCSLARGILVPQPGVKPMSPALGGGLLATGPAGKSHQWLFSFLSNSTCICLQPLPASQNQGPYPGLLLHKFLVCSGQNREVIEVRRVQWHSEPEILGFLFFSTERFMSVKSSSVYNHVLLKFHYRTYDA